MIILTHHAPTNFRSINLDTNDPESKPLAYGMNYESMERLFREPVIGWFFGHTHYNTDFLLRSESDENWTVRIAANQQGYIAGHLADKAPADYLDQKVIVFPNDHDVNKDVEIVEFEELRKCLVSKQNLVPKGELFKNIADSMDDDDDQDKQCNGWCRIL